MAGGGTLSIFERGKGIEKYLVIVVRTEGGSEGIYANLPVRVGYVYDLDPNKIRALGPGEEELFENLRYKRLSRQPK